jgi:hypothetical protein
MTAQRSRLTYRDVVAALPTLETEEQINLLEILSSVLKQSLIRKGEKHSLIELEGLGAEVWTKVDVDEYLRHERDSWS